jgi:6-phosphogluconate dehydrogenase
MSLQAFGIIGLEVMGRNIALNIERNGFPIAVYNRTTSKAEHFLAEEAKGKNARMGATPQAFVALLQKPRRILMMVKAGFATDATIDAMKPFLEPADVLIDGGNALYNDTERRAAALAPTGIKFFGMGVSGGEEGAPASCRAATARATTTSVRCSRRSPPKLRVTASRASPTAATAGRGTS